MRQEEEAAWRPDPSRVERRRGTATGIYQRVARMIFVTGTSPDVRGGSGTFVGISVLRDALVGLGHEVHLLTPAPRGGTVSLAERLAFNLRARRALRGRESAFDAVVGFDLDGVFLAKGIPHRVAAVKGVTAEEARNERGAARARLTLEAIFERRHVRGADRVVATSAHSAARIIADYGVQPDRIAVVPEPIDLFRWQRALEQAAGPPASSARSILCVAHLYPRKDVATLLEAVARLPEDVSLRVVGTGPELEALQELARSLSIDGRVAFPGHVSFATLAAEYRRAQIFCLPSRQEGFGIVFLEAMAAGLPIVAARAAAVPEIVLDGENGRLVSPGDPAALADALARLFNDPAERRALREGGLRRVRDYDAPRVARRFLEAIGLGEMGDRRR